jgi:hypothetical protein
MADAKSPSSEDRRLQGLAHKLYEAAREGRVDDVSQLSTHFTGDVYTLGWALYTACRWGQLNVVTWLVEHTVLRDDGERLGRALVEACRNGQLNVVTWLVEHTVLRDGGGRLGRALVRACTYRQWNIVKWLVTNTQVDVNCINEYSGDKNSALHLVVKANTNNSFLPVDNKTELCRLVYVCGKDVNVEDNFNGDTPLHQACGYFGNSDSVGALLLAGADESITDDEGLTPVQRAVQYERVKVLPLLDVSSKWKLLVRSHRLRRRTAVRVMMTLVTWKVQQTRSMWTRAIMTLHTIIRVRCTVYTFRHNYQHMYTPRMHKQNESWMDDGMIKLLLMND